MKRILISILSASILASGAGTAAVTDAAPGGFTTVNDTVIDSLRMATWRAAIDDIDQWWDPAHTVSGDALRLRIDARPQGCFCEDLGDRNGVVHMTVTMVSPGILLRLTGALGPLGLLGVAGNMTWEFADDPAGTRVKFTYAVGGYRAGGLDEYAGPVDRVIGEALQRLKAHVETGEAGKVGRD